MKMKTNRQEGFSLIELLIVVAIIGIIAAIAIPNLLASRRAANEGSAQSSMRTIHSSEAVYQATAGNGGFGTLAQLNTAELIDDNLGVTNVKSGYTFECLAANVDNVSNPATFYATSVPSAGPPRTGHRAFVIAEDGILRGKVSDAKAANHGAATTDATWPQLGN